MGGCFRADTFLCSSVIIHFPLLSFQGIFPLLIQCKTADHDIVHMTYVIKFMSCLPPPGPMPDWSRPGYKSIKARLQLIP